MPSYAVIGASRGIGLEFVRQFSADKENVVFAAVRNPSNSPKLLELQKTAPNVHIVQADLTDADSLQAAATEVGKVTGGKLDYLINNAATMATTTPHTSLLDFPSPKVLDDDLTFAFRTNVVGVVHATNAFLPLLRHGTEKRIYTLSTGFADTDVINKTHITTQPQYPISKAALNMVVAEFAAALAPEGFTVIAIAPGVVNTAEKPPSQQELEVFMHMFAKFKEWRPEWSGVPLTPEVSVTMMRDVLAKLGPKDSGAYLSQNGNQEWL